MHIAITPFLRRVLLIDGAAGLLMGITIAAAAPMLAPFFELPQQLLFWIGMALVPIGLFLIAAARRETITRFVLLDIIALNSTWAAASLGSLLVGALNPNPLGMAFVIGQALFVGMLAWCQVRSLRASPAIAQG